MILRSKLEVKDFHLAAAAAVVVIRLHSSSQVASRVDLVDLEGLEARAKVEEHPAEAGAIVNFNFVRGSIWPTLFVVIIPNIFICALQMPTACQHILLNLY